MNYSGAFGSDPDAFETASPTIKRNWWAAAREVIRVTKGKGVIVSGGITNEADLRNPRDIINLCVDPIIAFNELLTPPAWKQNHQAKPGSRRGSRHNEQGTSSCRSPRTCVHPFPSVLVAEINNPRRNAEDLSRDIIGAQARHPRHAATTGTSPARCVCQLC